MTTVNSGDGMVAALVHDESLLEDPGLVSAVAAAVRLTVDNERLRRELEERLDELAASRARIIAAGDEERRRIERDLHDGTQQRLVTIGLQLRLALTKLGEGGPPVATEALSRAVSDLADVSAEVRDLAHGIHPAILAEAGLEAALESLVDNSPLEIRTDLDVPADLSPDVAATAYFCASEALTNITKHAGATHVAVSAAYHEDRLEVTVADDGAGGAQTDGSGLTGLADRVARGWRHAHRGQPPGSRHQRHGGAPVRIVLADDTVLLRAGLAELLRIEGFDVVGEAGDAPELLELVRAELPDVAVVDVRMPPTHTVEGLVAARQLREEHWNGGRCAGAAHTSRLGTPSSCWPSRPRHRHL